MAIYERREAFPLFAPLSSAKSFSMEYLNQGRVGWDIPHTTAVANYAIQIARGEGLEELVMGTAAWLHDIGYCGLVQPNAYSYYGKSSKSIIQLHMEIGAELAGKFLETVRGNGWYTSEQEDKVVEIVGLHDNFDLHTEPLHFAFAECDTLGAICTEPTFTCIEDAEEFIEGLNKRRIPRFQTTTGKKILTYVVPQFLKRVDEMKLQRVYKSR